MLVIIYSKLLILAVRQKDTKSYRPPLFKAPTMNECEEARGLRSFAFQKDSNYSKNLLERSV